MLHRYINPFLDYCQLVDFSQRSIQAFTSRLNEFQAWIKSQKIQLVWIRKKGRRHRNLVDLGSDGSGGPGVGPQ